MMREFVERNRDEIEAILARFPDEHRRAAVLDLMYIAQREQGYVSLEAITEIAQILGIDSTQVGSLLGFYTLLYDRPGGKFRVQICTDLPCALRGAETFASRICENLGIRLGETTEDGVITIEEVMCVAGCDKAPLFQVQGEDGIHYHENQTVESTLRMIEDLRKRKANA